MKIVNQLDEAFKMRRSDYNLHYSNKLIQQKTQNLILFKYTHISQQSKPQRNRLVELTNILLISSFFHFSSPSR
jgi:negative regulator of sigma E activity